MASNPKMEYYVGRHASFPPRRSVKQLVVFTIWQYGLWSFQMGDTKLEIFLPKNQQLINFEFWINGELSKSAKIMIPKKLSQLNLSIISIVIIRKCMFF